jgi:maltooligosyltrehalose synthase
LLDAAPKDAPAGADDRAGRAPADGPGGPFPAGAWGDSELLLPDPPGTAYVDRFTGARFETGEPARAGSRARSALPLAHLFADFPVALLRRERP